METAAYIALAIFLIPLAIRSTRNLRYMLKQEKDIYLKSRIKK